MLSSPILGVLRCAFWLASVSVQAQAISDWSAIEVPLAPGAARLLSGRTVAPSGPAAALQPNAAQPAPGQRLKAGSRSLTGALDGILKLRPVQFTYLPGQGSSGVQYGVQPAELAKVYPELVKTDLLTGVQTINTSQLTPILIEAIKEQQQQIALLQQQQLQLAQVYAQLVQAASGRSTGVPGVLRRVRGSSTKKTALSLPISAPDSVRLTP